MVVGGGMMSSKKYPLPAWMQGLRGILLMDEPMSCHTSWRVGGRVEYFYTPVDKHDLIQLISQLPRSFPIYLVGLGSNLLVRDGDVPGMIIKTFKGLSKINYFEPDRIYAEVGASCAKVVRVSIGSGLQGVEFLSGIPGSFGGALAMNAGAFGGETWDWVEQIECIDRQGKCHVMHADSINYGYRNVGLPQDYWILSGWLRLHPIAENWQGKGKLKSLFDKRNSAQPVQSANAGSVFRNPEGTFAARLIEKVGLKGTRVGNAVISETHANFIVNEGGATAEDIESLIKLAKDKVYRDCNVCLQTEVRIIGNT